MVRFGTLNDLESEISNLRLQFPDFKSQTPQANLYSTRLELKQIVATVRCMFHFQP